MKKRLYILGATAIVAAFSTAQGQTTTPSAPPAPPGANPVITPAPAGAQAPATSVPPAPTTVAPTPATAPTTIAPQVSGAVAAPRTAVVLPAGTALLVRTTDPVSSASPPGTRFACTLDHDMLGADGSVALRAGTVIYGNVVSSSQAGRAVGQSSLDLRLSQISNGAQQIPIQTTAYQEAGQRSGRKVARGAAAGAGIGALAGNAGVGAAAGALAGGVVRRGQSVEVQPGTLLQFTLMQPVTVQR